MKAITTVTFHKEDQEKFLPSFLYYMMEAREWDYVEFGDKLYKREQLKGKENWKEVM